MCGVPDVHHTVAHQPDDSNFARTIKPSSARICKDIFLNGCSKFNTAFPCTFNHHACRMDQQGNVFHHPVHREHTKKQQVNIAPPVEDHPEVDWVFKGYNDDSRSVSNPATMETFSHFTRSIKAHGETIPPTPRHKPDSPQPTPWMLQGLRINSRLEAPNLHLATGYEEAVPNLYGMTTKDAVDSIFNMPAEIRLLLHSQHPDTHNITKHTTRKGKIRAGTMTSAMILATLKGESLIIITLTPPTVSILKDETKNKRIKAKAQMVAYSKGAPIRVIYFTQTEMKMFDTNVRRGAAYPISFGGNYQVLPNTAYHQNLTEFITRGMVNTTHTCTITYYLLPTTHYLLLTTYYLLRTTYYLLPNTYYLLLTTYYLLLIT